MPEIAGKLLAARKRRILTAINKNEFLEEF
jgi:hypothetical protein